MTGKEFDKWYDAKIEQIKNCIYAIPFIPGNSVEVHVTFDELYPIQPIDNASLENATKFHTVKFERKMIDGVYQWIKI